MKQATVVVFATLLSSLVQFSAPKFLREVLKLQDTEQKKIWQAYDDGSYTSHGLSFVNNNDLTITDGVTSLMWQKNSSRNVTWSQAYNYCRSLRFGSHSDWRLPFVQELYFMFNISKPNFPAPFNQITENKIYFWTNTSGADNQGSLKRWVVNSGGGTGPKLMSEAFGEPPLPGKKQSYFRAKCVRNATTMNLTHSQFEVLDQNTARDKSNGLLWQLFPSAPSKTWSDAVSYCRSLSYTEVWRLPNIKELFSTVDTNLFAPAVNVTVFKNVGSKDKYWSSTTEVKNTAQGQHHAWYVDYENGLTTYSATASIKYYVRCVTGGL
jgi:hypothetical protein